MNKRGFFNLLAVLVACAASGLFHANTNMGTHQEHQFETAVSEHSLTVENSLRTT